MTDVKKLREDVERRMRNGESYGLNEIRQIMKSTGLSYAQVIKNAKSSIKISNRQKSRQKQKESPSIKKLISQPVCTGKFMKIEIPYCFGETCNPVAVFI